MILLTLLLTLSSFAGTLAIYGEDNRQDIYQSPNPLHRALAKSTAALIEKSNLKNLGSISQTQTPSYAQMYKLCPQERFRSQPVAAICSGTLIAPNLILTAGHCYELAKQTCKDFVWAFDYKADQENQSSVQILNQNIYECEAVVAREINTKNNRDFALIKLKRQVLDRKGIKLSQTPVRPRDPLVMIGHPRGLPTKITDDAFVTELKEFFYYSNLDAFTMNSGSGVFNAETGEVVGLLTGGSMDFASQNGCTVSKAYSMNEGKEIVTKIGVVLELLKSSR